MSESDDCIIVDDNYNLKSITCENIPAVFLDKIVAKRHFSRFGKIKRFILRPKRLSCTVEYESEKDAKDALANAGMYNIQQFLVKYTENEVAHSRNIEDWVDPDVQSELDAMRPQIRLGLPVKSATTTTVKTMPRAVVKTKATGGNENLAKIPDSGLRNELETILRKQAFNNDDRLRILDSRDKLIRLTTTRTTDIKKAESIKGFCPDMCPEKERLLRENRNQVSIFEADEINRSVMDHRLAVKEYSRSSADQETPLSHELRPESVLKLTMNYLMHKIMDLCDSDVNISDWYHFIWDRTRGIRKDITQQELCSLEAVQLVEQCARFHIHCAARLVAEDPSVFDQKINTENLTKCLQTLKYMYHDLRLQGKACPNEAEFRAYIILLNLNDANFLWDVKQLPEQMQNSRPIRFALATYLAMESNNYVRFFRLVAEATYMNACILLRYFTQVRIRALRAIMIAYKKPMQMVSVPIENFKEILGFETDEAARMFFEYHGLDCEGDKVVLDKKAFYIPEMPFATDRAYRAVEAKRNCTVGEAICGCPLDSLEAFLRHEPHNSFDDDGFLKSDAWTAEDQMKRPQARKKPSNDPDDRLFKVPLVSSPISPKHKSPSPGLLVSPEANKTQFFQPISKPAIQVPASSIFSSISFGSQTQSQVDGEVSKPSVFALPVFTKFTADGTSAARPSVFGGTSIKQTNDTGKSLAAMSNDVFKHFQPEPSGFKFMEPSKPINSIGLILREKEAEIERERQAAEEEEKRRKLVEARQQKEREEAERQRRLKEEEAQRIQEEHRRKQLMIINGKCAEILSELIEDETEGQVEAIARQELNKYNRLLSRSNRILDEIIDECTEELLADIVKEETTILALNQHLMHKYFAMWRSNVRFLIEQRRLMESTPIWISDRTVSEAHPQQDQTLELMPRYLSGVPTEIRLKSHSERPIDIFRICSKPFQKQTLLASGPFLRTRKYFKFVISLPQEQDECNGFNSYLNSWLAKSILRRDATKNTKEFFCESLQGISLCLRKIEGVIPKNESDRRVSGECDHAGGLMFVMTCGNFLNSRKRLHTLLKLSKIYTKIPVAVIVYNPSAEEEFIENELHLQKLIDDEKISYYSIFPTVVFIRQNNMREAFVEAFKFLAQYSNQTDELEMQNLVSFLRTTLGDEFWKRLADTSLINPSFRKLCSQPAKVAELYNEAIDLLIQMLDCDYDDYPEFPQELKRFVVDQNYDIPLDLEHFPDGWKDETRNLSIREYLESVKLQPLNCLPDDLPEIEQSLLDYSTDCIQSESAAKRAGYTAIKHLLEVINLPEMQDIQLADRFNSISWLPIIASISLELLTTSWHAKATSLPQEIIYRKAAFKEYNSVPWWFDNVTLKSIKMQKKTDADDEDEAASGAPSAKRSKLDEYSFDIDALLARSSHLLDKADRNIELYKEISTKSREIARPLDEKLYEQELFNRNLKRFLRNNF